MLPELQNIFTTMPISGSTINSVRLHPSFVTLIYVLILLSLVTATSVYFSKKQRFSISARKAVAAAFFVSGFLWAIHADISWTTWLRDDLRNLGGLETDQKLLKLDGRLYDFVRSARGVLSNEYVLVAPDDYLRLRFEYFLLPLRKREQAADIVVLGNEPVQYDQATRTFTKGSLIIVDVEPILAYARNACVLRKR